MPRGKAPDSPRYVFALDTVAVRKPFPLTVIRGDVWHADHPIVLAHPDLFSADPPVVHPRNWVPPVEQATAAPGELRG
jgi:hypothetical protein